MSRACRKCGTPYQIIWGMWQCPKCVKKIELRKNDDFLATKNVFNLDCYYCIYEDYCINAHTWKTGEKDCKSFRGA